GLGCCSSRALKASSKPGRCSVCWLRGPAITDIKRARLRGQSRPKADHQGHQKRRDREALPSALSFLARGRLAEASTPRVSSIGVKGLSPQRGGTCKKNSN